VILAEQVALDASFLVAGAVIVSGVGIALFSWTLVTVVRLTQLLGVLEEKVRQLANDIDDLTARHPEHHNR
jgi:hypothetical protein